MAVLVIDTDKSGVTVLAIGFVLVAYVVHPAVRWSLGRVRAYAAWRAIGARKIVDVTHVPLPVEILRSRGGGSAGGGSGDSCIARITASLFAIFVVACWVFAVCVDIADVDKGPVDFLDRPPPVLVRAEGNDPTADPGDGGSSDVALTGPSWEVLARDEISLGGMKPVGKLGEWKGDVTIGTAFATYRVRSETVHGSIVSSWWSDQPLKAPSTLYYSQNAEDGESALLEKLSCTSQSASGLLFVGENATESWGKYFECASGPSMMSEDSEDSSSMSSSSPSLTTNSTTAAGEGVLKTNTTTTTTTSTTSPYASPPPSVVIIHDTNESHVHLVVEENSGGNYPAFLYSVWTARASYGGSAVTIRHMFHIAAQARLAEAIISGLVHGAKTGGQCVYVREQFSWRYPFYSDYAAAGRYRAGPLGEQPGNSTVVKDLSQVETVQAGVEINSLAGACILWLLLVSVVAIGGALCLHPRIGIDVYDRDELIKAVCLHAQRKANNGHNDNNNDDRAASASALRGMAPVATVPAVPPVPRPSSNGTAEKNTTMSRLLVRKDDTSGALTVIVDNNAEKQDNVCYGWRDMIWFHPCYRPKTASTTDEEQRSSSTIVGETGIPKPIENKQVVKLSCELVTTTCSSPRGRGYGPALSQSMAGRLKPAKPPSHPSNNGGSAASATTGSAALESELRCTSPGQESLPSSTSTSASTAVALRQAWPPHGGKNVTGTRQKRKKHSQSPSAAREDRVEVAGSRLSDRSSAVHGASSAGPVEALQSAPVTPYRNRNAAQGSPQIRGHQVGKFYASTGGIEPIPVDAGESRGVEGYFERNYASVGGTQRGSAVLAAAVVAAGGGGVSDSRASTGRDSASSGAGGGKFAGETDELQNSGVAGSERLRMSRKIVGSRSQDAIIGSAMAFSRGNGEDKDGPHGIAGQESSDERAKRSWSHSVSLPPTSHSYVDDSPYVRLSATVTAGQRVAGSVPSFASNGDRHASGAPRPIGPRGQNTGEGRPAGSAAKEQAASTRKPWQIRPTTDSGRGGERSVPMWSRSAQARAVGPRQQQEPTIGEGAYASAPVAGSASSHIDYQQQLEQSQHIEVTRLVRSCNGPEATKAVAAAAPHGDYRRSKTIDYPHTASDLVGEKIARSWSLPADEQSSGQLAPVRPRAAKPPPPPQAPSYEEVVSTSPKMGNAAPSYAEVVFSSMPSATKTFSLASRDAMTEEKADNRLASSTGGGRRTPGVEWRRPGTQNWAIPNHHQQRPQSDQFDLRKTTTTTQAAAAASAGTKVDKRPPDSFGWGAAAPVAATETMPVGDVRRQEPERVDDTGATARKRGGEQAFTRNSRAGGAAGAHPVDKAWHHRSQHSVDISTNSSAPTTPRSSSAMKSPVNSWLGPALGGPGSRSFPPMSDLPPTGATNGDGGGGMKGKKPFQPARVLPPAPLDSLVLSVQDYRERGNRAGGVVIADSSSSEGYEGVSASSGRGILGARGRTMFDAVSLASTDSRLRSVAETSDRSEID